MAGRPRKAQGAAQPSSSDSAQVAVPHRPWRLKDGVLPRDAMQKLLQVAGLLDSETRSDVGLTIKIPIFIKDPAVALDDPVLGVQQIEVRRDPSLGKGPTSSRVAVVDFDADTRQLCDPVDWFPNDGWFRAPTGEWLPDLPVDEKGKLSEDPERYREFLKQAVNNQHFRQLNAWAVVQRVLEFYEHPQSLGRAVPWGFDGNRLIVVPHAGYGENAFYDQHSKSLQFYYFGDVNQAGYTCLSHDIIAHETGHAVLDGIRPLYNESCSVQTAAFHEFVGDLTAILLALFNNDVRHQLRGMTMGDLSGVELVADLARQFGEAVEGRRYLRSATNLLTMQQVEQSMSPHAVSQVLTGTMFEILVGITKKQMQKGVPDAAAPDGASRGTDSVAGGGNGRPASGILAGSKVSPAQALWRAAGRFRSIALQPLDLCPPCDIQFVDYAKAILRNHILTDPVDERGYRQMMLDVFHRRGLCTCGRRPDQELTPDCVFFEVMEEQLSNPTDRLIGPQIDRVSRSRAAAYYFLNDNRELLRIPPHQDIVVVDLYDNFKMGAAADRLPREIVLEYLWEEEVLLEPDENEGLDFGSLNGQAIALQCGGTLVFDDRGNVLSWFHKPGTEHITPEEVFKLGQKKKPDKLDRARLADLQVGQRRKNALMHYAAAATKSGLVGETQSGNPLIDRQRPISAVAKNGLLHLEVAPHLRKSDFDKEVERWPVNY